MRFSLEWSMDDHTKDSKKVPQIRVPITCHWNLHTLTTKRKKMVRSSPPVLSIQPCKSKLDEEKSKHVELAEETGFGSALHVLLIGSIGLL
jgi:hypothetical protein